MSEIITFNSGSSSIFSSDILQMIPIGFEGTSISHEFDKGKITYNFRYRITDADIKVMLAILKIYADNNFENINNIKNGIVQILDDEENNIKRITVDTRDVAEQALGRSKRFKDIFQSLRNISNLEIFIESETTRASFRWVYDPIERVTGDFSIINVGLRWSLIKNISLSMMQYNFDIAMTFTNLNFRLYMAMQLHKHKNPKTKQFNYNHQINHDMLVNQLQLQNDSNKARVKKKILNAFIILSKSHIPNYVFFPKYQVWKKQTKEIKNKNK
jgi:hypothetical protein